MCAFTLIIWLWSWSFIKSQHDIPYWRTMYYALFYCALFQFHHVVEHVPEVLNVAVDALSRNNLHLFSSLLPQATAPRSRPHYLISCWFAGQTRDRTATNCYLPCNHLLILPFPFPKCSPVVFGTPSWHWFLTCIHRFVSVWLTVCSDSGWVARSSVVDLPPAELCVMHQVRYTVCSLPSPYYPPVLLDTWCQPGPLSLHDHTMLWAASYLGFFFFGFLRSGEFTCPSWDECPMHSVPWQLYWLIWWNEVHPMGRCFCLRMALPWQSISWWQFVFQLSPLPPHQQDWSAHLVCLDVFCLLFMHYVIGYMLVLAFSIVYNELEGRRLGDAQQVRWGSEVVWACQCDIHSPIVSVSVPQV